MPGRDRRYFSAHRPNPAALAAGMDDQAQCQHLSPAFRHSPRFGPVAVGVMFLFAWSSVMLNLRAEVYTPVMSTFLEFKKQPERPPKTTDKPMLDWSQAYDIAVAAMDEVARTQGFTVNFPSHLFYNRRLDAFIYFANTSRDVTQERGQTGVVIDARSGISSRPGFLPASIRETPSAAGCSRCIWRRSSGCPIASPLRSSASRLLSAPTPDCMSGGKNGRLGGQGRREFAGPHRAVNPNNTTHQFHEL